MKNTFKIIQLQLSNLVYSPIPWLLIVAVIVQSGITFSNVIELYEERYRLNYDTKDLTKTLYSADGYKYQGIFLGLIKNLYLYFPLLTMGLISQEISSGSIKLLTSSPLTSVQIVLGKFFAMICYVFIIIAVLLIFVLISTIYVDGIVYSWIISGLIGIILLSSTYMAAGLFISSFSAYQVVSALITFVVLGVLSFIGQFFQGIPILNDVAFWLSLTGRAEDFINGLIKSQNIAYFLILTLLLLFWTIKQLEFAKKSSNATIKLGNYGVPLLVAVVIARLTSLPEWTFYYDTTDNKRNTVAESGQKILKALNKEPVEITTYVNIMDDSGNEFLSHNQNSDYRRFERYRRFNSNLKMNYVYFYDSTNYINSLSRTNPDSDLEELAKKRAISLNIDFNTVLSPSEIKEIVNLSDEDNQTIRQFRYNEKKSFSRLFEGAFIHGNDDDKLAAFKRLIVEPQLIGFTVGHGERSNSDKDYRDYHTSFNLRHQSMNSLLNYGFEVVDVVLDNGSLDAIDILVIADPQIPFSEVELKEVIEFIDNGGNLFLAAEKENQNVLEPLLDKLGVRLLPYSLSQQNQNLDDNVVFAYFDKNSKFIPSYFVSRYYLERNTPLTMNGVAALEFSDSLGFKIEPLFVVYGAEKKQNSEFLVSNTAKQETLTVAVNLERTIGNKRQRIIVSGDADFISTGELKRRSISSINDEGVVNLMFHWLSNGEYPIDLTMAERRINNIKFGEKNRELVTRLRIGLIGVFPGIILLFGAVLLFKRNRN